MVLSMVVTTNMQDSYVEEDDKSSERCVYYQNDEGLWKCRKCCWTYRCERSSGSTNGQSSEKYSSIEHNGPKELPDDRQFYVETKIADIGQCLSHESKLEHEEELEHDSFASSNDLPSELSPKEDNPSFKSSSYKALKLADTDLLYESDHEATELNVERVLRKQVTHDIYCPNCKSCITRRIIVRKRKQLLPNSGKDSIML